MATSINCRKGEEIATELRAKGHTIEVAWAQRAMLKQPVDDIDITNLFRGSNIVPLNQRQIHRQNESE